jgi:iron complex transport system ATP-binding protein
MSTGTGTVHGPAADGGGPSALDARSVSVALGGRTVLDRVSLSLRPGRWTAIVGPNGAGKSTLLSVLAGLRRPDAGEVALDGRPLAGWPARERARRIAWLSQDGEADGDIAARDVVMLGRLPHHGLLGAPDAGDATIVEAAMRETACAGFAARRLSALSGGERQRVLIARAFAVGAPVMLLDEPTAHLDAPHQRALARSLRARARAGAAIATVLHDLAMALAADRVAVVAGRRLHAEGEPSDPAVRAALVRVFEDAIRIERLTDGRWIAVPSDD